MNRIRNLLLAVTLCGLTSALYSFNPSCTGGNETFHNDNLQRDMLVIQNYVNAKRSMTLEEKAYNLSISGDIRGVYGHIIEKINNARLRGATPPTVADADAKILSSNLPVPLPRPIEGTPYSNNAFKSVFNLYTDYSCDRAWGVAWVQFNNIAGIQQSSIPCMGENLPIGVNPDPHGMRGSGCCDSLCVRKAYLGYNVWADGCNRFDVEVGRRPLYTIMDSLIEFQNRFDGVLLRYGRGDECYGDFYFNLGGFVIDERVNHFAYIAETGWLDILNTGLNLKYSYVDWTKRGINRCQASDPIGWKFRVNQAKVSYDFTPDIIWQPVEMYFAYLWNMDADKLITADTEDNYNKRNSAFYAGFTIGRLCCKGDWAFEVNYQYVGAQAIPDNDISGISNGNVLQNTFTQTLYGPSLLFGETQIANARGRGNYRGWFIEGGYALTDNLIVDAKFEFSQSANKFIGGKHSYSLFKFETIYAF